MSSQTIESWEVLIERPEELYELLNEAEDLLRQAAMAHGSVGIRVTRHDPARYTFELSDTVPLGETWEQLGADRPVTGIAGLLSDWSVQQRCLLLADTPRLGLRPGHPSAIVLELQAGKFQPSNTHLSTLADSTFALRGTDGDTAP
ncbi:hypothetical protein [Arthrobacter sp. UYEF21]|uniref:hypothetical protein n=1 Tax=Arthrobacter sp. UYEF21 TaxID=1756364 RepID=UPI0033979491